MSAQKDKQSKAQTIQTVVFVCQIISTFIIPLILTKWNSMTIDQGIAILVADVSVLFSVAGVDACCPPLDPHPASIVTAMAVARSVLNNFFLIKSNLPCLVCFC